MPTINYGYAATFDPATYRPTFDPTGTLLANRVSGERHTITAANARDFHFIVPLFAPFFATEDALSIVYRPSGGAERLLVEGVDYNLAFEFIGATRGCGKPLYGGISFLNKSLAGVVTLAYRTLGGNWNIGLPEINRILGDALVNPRVTAWEQVVDRPVLFPVIDHEWNLQDLVGMSAVVQAIQALGAVIAGRPVPTLSPLGNHVTDYDNPHQVSKAHVGLGNVQNYPIATQEELLAGAGNRYVTPAGIRGMLDTLAGELAEGLQAHLEDYDNPHQVSKAHVGLGNVQNYSVATLAEATAGTLGNRYMTPALVRAVLEQYAGTLNSGMQTHIDNLDNPHQVTKAQVGLGNVQNYLVANDAEAEAGQSQERYTTPYAVRLAIDKLVPAATNLAAGKVSLNLGDEVGDAINDKDALTSTGLTALLSAAQPNPLKAAVRAAAPATSISQTANNLLQLYEDGLYYGVTAPPDVATLYVDATAGNDSFNGTRETPVRTIREALSRGAVGLSRTLYLREVQNHYVDPAAPAVFRGGTWSLFPYGPQVDALPPVAGSHKLAQVAALPLSPTIVSMGYANAGTAVEDGGNGVYQGGNALYPSNKAFVSSTGINFTCGAPNDTGAPVSAYNGSFHHPYEEGSWFIGISVVTLPHVSSRFFSHHKMVNVSAKMSTIKLQGPGKITEANSQLLTLNVDEAVIGSVGSTATQWRSYLAADAPVSSRFNGINTNLLPDVGTPLSSPLMMASSPMNMAQDGGVTKGSATFLSNGVAGGDANLAGCSFFVEGYHGVKLGLRSDGVFGLGGWSSLPWRWYVNPNGDMVCAGEVYAYSDPELKKDISPIAEATQKLKRLNGVYFTWKNIAHVAGKAGKRDLGVLADQVETIFPEMVSTSIGIDGKSYRTVAYSKLVPVLIQSIKELSERLDALEAKAK